MTAVTRKDWMRWARWAVEALVVLALACTAAWYGKVQFLNSVNPGSYYQSEFGVAVRIATGHGFENPVVTAGTPLAEFLLGRTATLDPRDAVPEGIVRPNQFQYATRYLMTAVGYWWRFAGISWDAVAGVAAALHVLAVLGVYAMLRLFVPIPLAVLGAFWICTSTLQLGYLPHLRDYSKGAFITAAIPLVIALAVRARALKAALAVAVATGVVIGVGFGFKMDVAVMAPIAVVAVVAFRGRRPWTDLTDKAKIVAALVLALLVSAAPVLTKLSSGGSNSIHVILLGYAEWFDAGLGIEPSVYRYFPYYSDTYMMETLRVRVDGQGGPWLDFPSVEYDQASADLWGDIVRHFPADTFGRTLAAADATLNLVFANPAPTFFKTPLPAQEYVEMAFRRMNRWRTWGATMGALLVVVASMASIRLGAFAGFLVLALAGYPSLQFDLRHSFQLQSVSVTALLVLAWAAIRMPVTIWTTVSRWREGPLTIGRGLVLPAALKLVAAGTILAVLVVIPLTVLRSYQSFHVRTLLESYLREATETVRVQFVPQENRLWLARWPGVEGRLSRAGHLQSAYYLMAFQAANGPPAPVAIGLRYWSTRSTECPRRLLMQSGPGVAWFGFPVVGTKGQHEFEGIEMPAGLMNRVIGVYRMDGGPAGIPLELRMPAEWQDRELYQQLAMEDNRREITVQVAATASGSCEQGLGFLDGLEGLVPDPNEVDSIYTPSAVVTAGGIQMEGVADTESSELVRFKAVTLDRDAALVARGRLDEGGVVIGLLKDGRWYGQVSVQQPGEFVVVIPVNESGTFVPTITNAMPSGKQQNKFEITRFGLAKGDLPAAAAGR